MPKAKEIALNILRVDNQFGRETWSLSELLDLCGWDVESYKIIEREG